MPAVNSVVHLVKRRIITNRGIHLYFAKETHNHKEIVQQPKEQESGRSKLIKLRGLIKSMRRHLRFLTRRRKLPVKLIIIIGYSRILTFLLPTYSPANKRVEGERSGKGITGYLFGLIDLQLCGWWGYVSVL